MTATPTQAHDDGRGRVPPFGANLKLAAIGLGALMAALAQTLIIPVLPRISQDIGASPTESQWLLTATLLVAAVSVSILGRLADMFGRRLMLLVAVGALAVGSTIDALTSEATLMIIGRALTGVASAAIPLGISLLAAVLPEERKGSAVALISATLGVGGALGLPLAGLIADSMDYHVLYWIGAIGAALSIAATAVLVREPEAPRGGFVDFPGMVLLAGALACLVLPLSLGGTWGWTSAATIGLFVVAAVLFVSLYMIERRVRNPLVDMASLARPSIALTNVASVFIGFALFASFVGTANYVQAPEATGYGFGSSVLVAGMCLLPSGVLMLVLAPPTARLIAVWAPARVLVLASTIIAAGLVMRIVLVDQLWQIIFGTAIVGVGTGVGYAALPALIIAHTPTSDLAAANGINTLARSLGSTLASAVGGSLLAAVTVTVGGREIASLTAYRILFGICAGSAVLAALMGIVMSARDSHVTHRGPLGRLNRAMELREL